ncbi:phosphotransferase [Mycobacterium sp.]|uniref:phosphotransferase n=1 Tax=Mycobacterium sp. TaxID=1785 RepID=UPI002D39376B|nr:phosphotransferase [Mycobacterium sp.]HZA12207.1 phosphotransferase [Mycobacterium sp.]
MHTLTGAEITIDDEVVVKVHRVGTDPRDLATRLSIAARLCADGRSPLLGPLSTMPERVGSRWRSRWPRVDTGEPGTAMWAEAGRLLAQLHREPLTDEERSVQQGGPQRLRRALYTLNHGGPVAAINQAAATIPLWVWMPGAAWRPRTLVHGDWHVGQLGRRPRGPWQLIDVDDLGVGDPAWDLGRPAGFWAAGLLSEADWHAFLGAYRAAGGVAVPAAPADPWPVLEPFARAGVVEAAAAAVTHRRDEEQALLIDACARMAA